MNEIITLFLLISLIIFVSYKTFKLYHKYKKDKHSKLTNTKRKKIKSFNQSQDLISADKEFIHFLKTNTDTYKPQNKTFRVQNLLNEVYGLVESKMRKFNIEFIYDIDINLPIELVSDPILLEQALYSLLMQNIESSANATLIVSFKINNTSKNIIIEISNSKMVDFKNISSLKTTHLLLDKLQGTLSVKQNVYTVHLPFLHSSVYIESYYSLPQTVVGQKVLLIEDHQDTAKVIAKGFNQFGLSVKHKKSSHLSTIQNFADYDIIILDHTLLTPTILRHIEEIKTKKALYILSLEKLYGLKNRQFKPSPVISKYLYKPLSIGMIYGFLYEIYIINSTKTLTTKEKKKKTDVFFLKEAKNITRDDFENFNTLHVLIVDDNRINQKIIQNILGKSDIEITLANNGQEAVDAVLNDASIDIVLMDINMPVMDGYQATKKIREDKKYATLPIIVVSTLGFRNEIEQMYIAGANAHLTKPFKIGELYSALDMFKPTLTNATTNAINTQYNNELLDIQKGNAKSKNILAYRDALREALFIFKDSDERIKTYIITNDLKALYQYCLQLLEESEQIGTVNLSQILTELLILSKDKEIDLLQTYIERYRESWLNSKRSIELYLKSVNSY